MKENQVNDMEENQVNDMEENQVNDMEENYGEDTNGSFPEESDDACWRRVGTWNQSPQLLQQLLVIGSELIIRKTMGMAMEGNVQAAKLVLDRVLPVRRERYIQLEFKPLESPEDVQAAFDSIMGAVAEGRITPGDGQTLAEILNKRATALASARREQRIFESMHPRPSQTKRSENLASDGFEREEFPEFKDDF